MTLKRVLQDVYSLRAVMILDIDRDLAYRRDDRSQHTSENGEISVHFWIRSVNAGAHHSLAPFDNTGLKDHK